MVRERNLYLKCALSYYDKHYYIQADNYFSLILTGVTDFSHNPYLDS